jgi:hypothetical protein
MASISITYTPNYEGCHRIYFKPETADDYCMYIDNSSSVIGEPKTTVIELVSYLENCLVPDPITCTDFAVDGYVQPCCAAESDLASRIPFSFDALTDKCETYQVYCLKAGISNIVLNNKGNGYVTAPTITLLNGGSGAGFLYTVNMLGGAVDSVTIIDNGDGYPDITTVQFSASPTGDTATGTIEFCPCGTDCGATSKVSVTDCVDDTKHDLNLPFPGRSYNVCSKEEPTVFSAPAAGTTKADTTCCECTSYNIINNDKTRALTVPYIGCDNEYTLAVIPALGNTTVCAVTGSLALYQDYKPTITSLGSCS